MRPTNATGRVYTWVTTHRPLGVDLGVAPPYTTVIVDLTEGARIYGRLANAVVPTAGMRVRGAPAVSAGRAFVEFYPEKAEGSSEP
jgi:uncharacterized OB-fold protein